MIHAVIVAHPKPESFVMAMAHAYVSAVEVHGHTAIMRDLYRMGFDPCLHADEIAGPAGVSPHADVRLERRMLKDANVFALFYPLWLNAPPAIMKGYLERVFGMGFAYGRAAGGPEPLLAGRKLITVSTSGAPMDWVVRTGAWDAMRTLFDEHFAAVCGLEIVDHLHFGGIVPGIRADAVARNAENVREAVARHF